MCATRTTVFLAFLTVIFTACAPVTHQTPSGRPEVTIANTPAADVLPALTNQMIDRGYLVKSSSPGVIVFERQITDRAGIMFFGSDFNPRPSARLTCMLVESGHDTRVVSSLGVITNPGTGFERVTPFDNSLDSNNIQQALYFLKMTLEPSHRKEKAP